MEQKDETGIGGSGGGDPGRAGGAGVVWHVVNHCTFAGTYNRIGCSCGWVSGTAKHARHAVDEFAGHKLGAYLDDLDRSRADYVGTVVATSRDRHDLTCTDRFEHIGGPW